MDPEQFLQALKERGLVLSEEQVAQFATYFHELRRVNEQMNLTRITSQEDVYLKHFYDSLTPLIVFKEAFTGSKKLCDVGSGAGFPGIPLKILQPQLKLTIVDSLAKRLQFLKELTAILGLKNVELVHGRVEDIAHQAQWRETFDLTTARAVAKLNVLSEYCLPLVRKGGQMIALKGPRSNEELAHADRALKLLGGKLSQVRDFTLPDSTEQRTLIQITKVKPTPGKYPRQAGTPNRKPL